MRIAGRLTAKVFEALDGWIEAGQSTWDVDQFCQQQIEQTHSARAASIGQYGYGFASNTSINDVICHGVPSKHCVLKDGDILNVDITLEKNGFICDSSKMYLIGSVSAAARRLVDTTQACLYRALTTVRPGACLGDIGESIQTHAESSGYSVVREFCGHGIGRAMHEAPNVLHFGRAGTGQVLRPGMTFTIEPMINQGTRHIQRKHLKDWAIIHTRDGALSAQWEHTVLVTDGGCEVLTLRAEEKPALQQISGICKSNFV